jgi:hypothetical protein
MEVFGELAAVVGEHAPHGYWEHDLGAVQGQGSLGTGARAERQGEAEAAGQIDAGHEVAGQAILAAFDGIQGHAVARPAGSIALGFAHPRPAQDAALSEPRDAAWRMAHLVGGIGDQPPDGAYRGTAQRASRAPRRKERVQLLLAQVRVLRAQAADLVHQGGWPDAATQSVRAGARGRTRSRFAAAAAQSLPPCVQRPSRDLEGFLRGQKPVLLPEAQDAVTRIGVGTDHAPAESTIGDAKKALYPIANPSDLHFSPSG